MPFKQVIVEYEAFSEALEPKAAFGNRNKFGHRIGQNPDGKKAVAYFVASQFAVEGSSIFATDGSSTFYVCLAMALCSFEFEREFDLLTNNVGLAQELEAQPYSPFPKVSIRLLGGPFDYTLNACFPPENDGAAWQAVRDARLSIVSVRELFIEEGPTSPETRSCLVKQHALRSHSELVLPMDWKKLGSQYPRPGSIVFNDSHEWKEILQKANRKITIVCDKPLDIPDNIDSEQKGRQLDASGFQRQSRARWESGTDYERYCWQAYQFSLFPHITFVEVHFRFD